MSRSSLIAICFYTAISLVAHGLQAEEDASSKYWSNFRGPTLNGVSATAKPPSKWSATKNVLWKTEIPGRGSASPIVWEDKIFVATAVNTEAGEDKGAGQQDQAQGERPRGGGRRGGRGRGRRRAPMNKTDHDFVVMCINRADGKVLWKKTAITKKPNDSHHPDHGFASASPITDGQHVYFSFGSNGIFCYDMDGKQVWKRTDFSPVQTRAGFGEGSSMALAGDMLIVPWDHEGDSRLDAINKKTGKTKWSTPRDEPSNWATPRIVTVAEKQQIIHSGENYSRGYDLETGKEIWRSSGLSTRPVSTPVVKGNLGFFASSRRGSCLNAYRLDKKGDISGDPAWKISSKTPDCPSLLLSENRLFYLSGNSGIISCANAENGEEIFGASRLDGVRGVYSSPVAADGKVFVTGRGGKTYVIEDGDTFKVVANNEIGENVDATLALVDDQIFIRGAKHLFCIQEKK